MKKNIYDETIKDFIEEWNLYQYSNNDEENNLFLIILRYISVAS